MIPNWFLPHYQFPMRAVLIAASLIGIGHSQTSSPQGKIQLDQTLTQAQTVAASAQVCTQASDFCMQPSFDLVDDPIQKAGLTKCIPPKPTFATLPLLAACLDPITFQPLPGAMIQLSVQAEGNTGGHLHGSSPRPIGPPGPPLPNGQPPNPLNPDSGTVGSDNFLHFTYTAPELSGVMDITLTATLPDGTACIPVTARVAVELPGFSAIPSSGPGYVTTTSVGHDSNNIFAIPSVGANLQEVPVAFDFVAQELEQEFLIPTEPIPTLTYTSLALPFGGLFDVSTTGLGTIDHEWHPPHCGHRRGLEADLLINNTAVPPEFRGALYWSIIVSNFTTPVRTERPQFPAANHWHLRAR